MLSRMSAAVVLSFLAIPNAGAIVVNGTNPNAPLYSGLAYTGVVRVYTDSSFCTGALFGPSRDYVLTAAHCLVNPDGSTKFTPGNSYVGIDGATSYGVVDYITAAYVAPGYTGNSTNYANDLAVVKLQDLAPSDAATYSLYTNTNELGKDVIIVGHGAAGTGTTGPTISQSADISGRRMGTNTYDVLASSLGTNDNTHILWDFDNGTNAQNALSLYGSSTGDGASEVSIAGGDSGGPSFYNGLIIGVHSYSECFSTQAAPNSCLSPPDIMGTTDGPHDTFGELAGDTRVSLYANNFLLPFVTSVPEPGTWAMMGAGTLLVLAAARRAKRA